MDLGASIDIGETKPSASKPVLPVIPVDIVHIKLIHFVAVFIGLIKRVGGIQSETEILSGAPLQPGGEIAQLELCGFPVIGSRKIPVEKIELLDILFFTRFHLKKIL